MSANLRRNMLMMGAALTGAAVAIAVLPRLGGGLRYFAWQELIYAPIAVAAALLPLGLLVGAVWFAVHVVTTLQRVEARLESLESDQEAPQLPGSLR